MASLTVIKAYSFFEETKNVKGAENIPKGARAF